MMDSKFDGPNIYSVLTSMASELSDQADNKSETQEISDLKSQLKTVEQDLKRKLNKIMTKHNKETMKSINNLKGT